MVYSLILVRRDEEELTHEFHMSEDINDLVSIAVAQKYQDLKRLDYLNKDRSWGEEYRDWYDTYCVFLKDGVEIADEIDEIFYDDYYITNSALKEFEKYKQELKEAEELKEKLRKEKLKQEAEEKAKEKLASDIEKAKKLLQEHGIL